MDVTKSQLLVNFTLWKRPNQRLKFQQKVYKYLGLILKVYSLKELVGLRNEPVEAFLSYIISLYITTRSKRVKSYVKNHVKTSLISHIFHTIFTSFHTCFTCLFHMHMKKRHVKSIWRVCELCVKNMWRMLSFSHAFSYAISHTNSYILKQSKFLFSHGISHTISHKKTMWNSCITAKTPSFTCIPHTISHTI